MPNCFTLTRNGEKEPRNLVDIDSDLWFFFKGEEPEGNTCWYLDWYDKIGPALACGKSLEWCKENWRGHQLEKVAEFLEANYVPKSWDARVIGLVRRHSYYS